jgi:hypothetical protein
VPLFVAVATWPFGKETKFVFINLLEEKKFRDNGMISGSAITVSPLCRTCSISLWLGCWLVVRCSLDCKNRCVCKGGGMNWPFLWEYLGDPGQGSINKIWDWTVAKLLFSPYRNQPLDTIITRNCWTVLGALQNLVVDEVQEGRVRNLRSSPQRILILV